MQSRPDRPLGSHETPVIDDKRGEIEISVDELSRTSTSSSVTSSIEEAKSQLREKERQHGYIHRYTIMSLLYLARMYESKSSFLSAELVYKRALVAILDSKISGRRYSLIAKLLEYLSEVEIEQGKFQEASQQLEFMLKFQQRTDGDDKSHALQIATTMGRLAVLYDKLKQWESAQRLYHDAIEKRNQAGQAETDETLAVMENLALSYLLKGGESLTESANVRGKIYEIRVKRFEKIKHEVDPQSKKPKAVEDLKKSSEYMSLEDSKAKLIAALEDLGDVENKRIVLDGGLPSWAIKGK